MPDNYARVSVVVPCYNCSHTVQRAVESVAKQTLLPSEVILVEDCSDDETLQTLYHLQALYPDGWIKVIPLGVNDGPGTARNAGWEVAKEPYIAFLDADDSWHPQKIEIQYSWMIKHPDVALSSHGCQQVNDESTMADKCDFSIVDPGFEAVGRKQLLLSNRFLTPSVVLRRDIDQRFQNSKRYCEDYHLWADICCDGLKCCRSELPLTYLFKANYGEAGLSAALYKMEKGELDIYLSLFKRRLIQLRVLLFLVGWSLTKFIRRIAIVSIKKYTGLR